MALDDLHGIVEKLRDLIETHRAYLSGDETRTRQVLIDPLLRELGWDVSNPDTVELEYRVEQQRADYALKSDSRRVALIEAKKLGNDLKNDEIMQVLNYANLAGIGYIIVTDGDRWAMYEVFKPVALEDRLLMKFKMSQHPTHESALQALAMWRPNFASDSGPSEATEPVFVSTKPLPDGPSRNSYETQELVPPDNSLGNFNDCCSFESKLYPKDTKPVRLKIDSRIDERVKYWLDVIHQVVAWLVDEKIVSINDCPIGTNKYTLIGREPKNPDGRPFKEPKPLPNGLFLQRGYVNTQSQWHKLRQILNQTGVDKSTIKVFYQIQ